MAIPTILCFTDGSCTGNGRRGAKGGIGVHFPDHAEHDVSDALRGKATSNRGELEAIIRAIEIVDSVIDPERSSILHIKTDSELAVKSFDWMTNWSRTGWKDKFGRPLKNLDLLQRLHELKRARFVKASHVRGHTGGTDYDAVHNDIADRLARAAGSSG